MFENTAIDCRKLRQGSDVNTLVDLVDTGIDRPDFNELRADVGDEAAIGRAAAGRQFSFDAGFRVDCCARGVNQCATAGKEGFGAKGPQQIVIDPVTRQYFTDFCLQPLGCADRGEAEVEVDFNVAWNDVAGAGAAVDVGNLPGGWREKLVALIPDAASEFGNDWRRSNLRA